MLGVADRHASRLARRVETALASGLSAIDASALRAAVARGDRHAAERIALAAFPDETLQTLETFRTARDENDLTEAILDVMEDSANATRCTVAPVGPHPDNVESTEAFYRTAAGRWTAERATLHDDIVTKMLGDTRTSNEPTVFMTGGGPASGKSTLLDSGQVAIPGRGAAVHVDADAIKAELPEYVSLTEAQDPRAAAFVHEESSYLSKRILGEASKRPLDIVYDTTGDGSVDNLASKLEPLRRQGHRVVGYYASNDTDLAVQLAEARGRKTGRFVPEQFIRDTHVGVSRVLPQAIERGLFDEVYLYDTNVKGQARLVMSARGRNVTIHNDALWRDFLRKAGLKPEDVFRSLSRRPRASRLRSKRGVPPQSTERLSSIVAALTLGVSLAAAERRGIVSGTVERATWRKLAPQVEKIKADGKIVDVQVDVIG
jgi:predicted ABC-type ATPase